MKVVEGKEVTESTEYYITFNYSGDLTLFDAAGYTDVDVYQPDYTIGNFEIIDAQTTSAVVTIDSWIEDKEYRIEVQDPRDEVVYAQWEGTMPEDGIIPIQLTKGGVELPATSYDSSFEVRMYYKHIYNTWVDGERVETYRWEYATSESFSNRYDNMRNEYVYFYPSYAHPEDKTIDFEIEFDSCSYWKGSGDVLSMRNNKGIEVGRCESMTLTHGNYAGSIVSGIITITGEVKSTTYYLYLNNVQFDTIYLTEDVRGIRSFQADHSTETIYPFMQLFPIEFEAINTSGKGYFVLREGSKEGTEVLRSGLMTGVPGSNRFHTYNYAFTKDEYSKLTEGNAYAIDFVDSNGLIYNIADSFTWTLEKSPLTTTGNNNMYILWGDLDEGEQEVEVRIYNYAMNFEETDLEAFKTIVLTNEDTSETFVVNGWKDIALTEDGYRAEGMLTLDRPVTLGDYSVTYNGEEIDTFRVYDTNNSPSVSGDMTDGYLRAHNIEADDVITGHIFQDYNQITEELITFAQQPANSENSWYLYFDLAVLKDLPDGDYEIRLYRNGEVFDTLEFTIYSPTKPIVMVNDEDEDWSDEGDPVVNSYEVSFEFLNIGKYGYLRWAETEELLAEQDFRVYMASRWYGHTFEGEDGPRTLYVELSPSGTADDPENIIYPLDLWLMLDPDYDLQVPENIQGVNSNRDEYTFTATTSIPATEVWIEFYDEEGKHSSQQMKPTGETEDGRYGFSLTVYPSDSFWDNNYSNNERFYYENTRNIRILTTNLSTMGNSNENYDGTIVGEPVERFFMFADPDSIVLIEEDDYYWNEFTNDPNYKLCGYTIPNGTVTVTEYEGKVTTGTATANEYGYFEFQPGNLADGMYDFTAADADEVIGSDTLRVLVDTVKPTITGATFDFVEGTALLRWGCSDTDVKHYEIYRNDIKVHEVTDGDDYGVNENVSFQANVSARYNDGNIFKIVAVDYAGNKSEGIDVSTDDVTAPTAPGTPVATATKTRSVTITWSAASDNVMVDHYEIYRDGVKVGETSDLTYTDGQLSDNTAYVYTVKAVDTRNNVSEASAALNVTTQVAPEGAAVSGIVIKEEHSTITVGKTLALTVEITPADAVNKLVEWTSSDETVATVDENGVVTAVGEGEAVITGVTDDGAYVAETVVTVYPYLVQLVEAARDEETGEIVYALQRYDESVAEAVAFITVYDENGKFVSVHEDVCEITENEMVFVNDKITVEEGQNVTIYLVDPTTFEPFCPEVEIE